MPPRTATLRVPYRAGPDVTAELQALHQRFSRCADRCKLAHGLADEGAWRQPLEDRIDQSSVRSSAPCRPQCRRARAVHAPGDDYPGSVRRDRRANRVPGGKADNPRFSAQRASARSIASRRRSSRRLYQAGRCVAAADIAQHLGQRKRVVAFRCMRELDVTAGCEMRPSAIVIAAFSPVLSCWFRRLVCRKPVVGRLLVSCLSSGG
jgi:hypothetical protein